LSLSRDGQLRQNPAPQLSRLRGKLAEWNKIHLENSGANLVLPNTNTLEIMAEIDLTTAKSIELKIHGGANVDRPVAVSFDGWKLQVLDTSAPLTFANGGRTLALRIFVDRSVLEVFANETVCATKIISLLEANPMLEIRAEGGSATVKRIQAWPVKTIW